MEAKLKEVQIAFTSPNNFCLNEPENVETDAQRVRLILHNVVRKAVSMAQSETQVDIQLWSEALEEERSVFLPKKYSDSAADDLKVKIRLSFRVSLRG